MVKAAAETVAAVTLEVDGADAVDVPEVPLPEVEDVPDEDAEFVDVAIPLTEPLEEAATDPVEGPKPCELAEPPATTAGDEAVDADGAEVAVEERM